MSTSNKVIPAQIHIVNFTIESASLKSELTVGENEVENHALSVTYDTQFNLVEKLVKATIQVDVTASIDGKEVGEGHFKLVFVFQVDNLQDLTQENDDQLIVNGGLSNALASISYSTTRGILMTRFQGTILKNFILPVINPNDLLDKS
ncbi:MAG: hypothetical protein WDZ45_02705 [Flavobacteriaceae bacterium]